MSSAEPIAVIESWIDEPTFDGLSRVAQRLASSADLAEVLGLVINALRDVLSADRASVFQYDADRHEFFATKAHGLGTDLRLPADKGIIGEAGRERAVINIPDAYADARFNQSVDKQTGYRTRCILTVPLLDHEGELVGVAQVLNKQGDDEGAGFTPRDIKLARHLADQAAVALRRATLIESEIAKRKLEADLEVAKRIQQSSLPSTLPSFGGYDIAGVSEAADQTGGDAFDVIDIAELPLKGHGLVFMGDATGHGIGPALSVVQVLAMVRMGARLSDSLDALALHVNDQLHRDLPVGRFVTAFFGLLDVETHELGYAAAGQAPLIVVRASGESMVLAANAMPLGIDIDPHADVVEPITLGPGDRFILLSDGYYEAAEPKTGEMFGEQRVIDIACAHPDRSAEELIAALRDGVNDFTGGVPREDDQTAVIIRRVE
ncbi:MAG: SpoIIE family protein phosphatase [Planctomycetota bacterium]